MRCDSDDAGHRLRGHAAAAVVVTAVGEHICADKPRRGFPREQPAHDVLVLRARERARRVYERAAVAQQAEPVGEQCALPATGFNKKCEANGGSMRILLEPDAAMANRRNGAAAHQQKKRKK